MGPPADAPNWLRLKGGFEMPPALSKKFAASSALFLRNSYAFPWNAFVPDFVTALITPPEVRPFAAE
jgi:hypothetical protein